VRAVGAAKGDMVVAPALVSVPGSLSGWQEGT
jgi:hypothetical protein